MKEESMEYYDQIFMEGYDTTRYNEIYEDIAKIVGDSQVIDIGCGNADLRNFIPNYAGFDYAVRTIGRLESQGVDVWLGNALEAKCFNPNNISVDYYICTEVLEHIIEDRRVIANIPRGSKIIFTVPSFPGRGHVRTFSKADALTRYADLIDINHSRFYSWKNGKWVKENKEEKPFIMLIKGSIK